MLFKRSAAIVLFALMIEMPICGQYWQAGGASEGDIYYDGGNVGIGTASPASKLSINGDIDISGSRFHVGTDGKIGMGTGSPATRLTIAALGTASEIVRVTSGLSELRTSLFADRT